MSAREIVTLSVAGLFAFLILLMIGWSISILLQEGKIFPEKEAAEVRVSTPDSASVFSADMLDTLDSENTGAVSRERLARVFIEQDAELGREYAAELVKRLTASGQYNTEADSEKQISYRLARPFVFHQPYTERVSHKVSTFQQQQRQYARKSWTGNRSSHGSWPHREHGRYA